MGQMKTGFAAAITICLYGPALAQSGDAPTGAASSTLPDCPARYAERGDPSAAPTEPFDCYCSAEARNARGGYAYGSGPYDGISNICMVALHAGATDRDGGDVRVIPGPLMSNYVGTLANGVFSSDWEPSSQFPSFNVEPAGTRPAD